MSQSGTLDIALGPGTVGVSYLSAMLRVVQATLRAVARGSEASGQAFAEQPQPMLALTTGHESGELVMRLRFTHPLDGTPLEGLSNDVFGIFIEEFGAFLKDLPQPGLWGDSAGGAQRRRYLTEVPRRMDQLRRGMLRFPRLRVSFGEHAVLFEDGRMEIS